MVVVVVYVVVVVACGGSGCIYMWWLNAICTYTMSCTHNRHTCAQMLQTQRNKLVHIHAHMHMLSIEKHIQKRWKTHSTQGLICTQYT